MSDSTGNKRTRKSKKKYPHPTLRIHKGMCKWIKKIDGRVYYFRGVDEDPKGTASMEELERVRKALEDGRDPPQVDTQSDPNALTVAKLVNLFLTHHEERRDSGEISPRTFQTLYATCASVVDKFGRNRSVTSLTPDDFRRLKQELRKKRKAVALRNEIMRVRSLFKFGFDNGDMLSPAKFGKGFDAPTSERIERDKLEKRMEHGD
jgi:hypothetical protein